MSKPELNRITALLADLGASPRGYLHSLDLAKGAGLVLEADRDFFRNAIFLDGRVLQPGMTGAWVPLAELWARTKDLPPQPIHFIFHVGHAGSTLLSRLLDEIPGVLGLREPDTLRTLVMLEGGDRGEIFEGVTALLGRRFVSNETVIVKATSICNPLAPSFVALHPQNRAVAMTVSLRAYLANLLDKKQATDIPAFAPIRLKGLRQRVPGFSLSLAELSLGELIALSWLAEVEALAHLKKSGGKTLFFDFDRLLEAHEDSLARIAAHFGLDPKADFSKSRVFDTYAKQPDFPFTAENRRRILAESEAAHGQAITAGEVLVRRLRAGHPALEQAVQAVIGG
jgi:hypothetical protein